MTDNAIEVVNLSKMFKLYSSQGKRLLDYASFGKKNLFQEFWALQDISFTVPRGSTFGILGQNGSGKSTLLSILAGVLEPSGGAFHVSGKVSAILELGAGFHPEFTGRANIFMYGSIMGLSKEEIAKRLPDIIHFSELGEFIDQPLRTYSSGMYARLAFSVAVNVDADILIVDEALSVGDALFQHRCFRKIHALKELGKTILYVGHDTEAVRSLCDHAMILDRGRMLEIGNSATISNKYMALIAEREQKYYESNLQEYGEKPDETWETVYNFIDRLVDADKKVQTPESIRELKIDIRDVPRRTIFSHPPSKLSYSVYIKEGYTLSFAIGIYPSAYDFISDGVKFRVLINEEEVFSRILRPKQTKSDRGWHNHMIDLSSFSRQKVMIHFITEGSGQDLSYCWGGWGWPSICQKRYYSVDNNLISNEKYIKEERFGSKIAEILKFEILDVMNNPVIQLNSGEKYSFQITIKCNESIKRNIVVGLVIKNRFVEVFGTNTLFQGIYLKDFFKNEIFTVSFVLTVNLNNGIYSTNCGIVMADSEDNVEVLDRRYDNSIFVVTKCPKIAGLINVYPNILISREKQSG